MSTTPSGWYPNPHNAAEELYWDGSRWLGASRVRIIENAGSPAYSSAVDDATVVRPAGGAWPRGVYDANTAAPGGFDPGAGGFEPGAGGSGSSVGGFGSSPNGFEPSVDGFDPGPGRFDPSVDGFGSPQSPGGFDPSWDTIPFGADGRLHSGFAVPGTGSLYPASCATPYPLPDYTHYPAPGVAPYPAPGYAQPDGSPFPPPFAPARTGALSSNGYALASLILGACGFVLTMVPFLVGLIVGGIPDLLAVVFGVIGIVRSRRVAGAGLAVAIVGTVLGVLGLGMTPFGAGWLW